jgi:hypothetical protein
MKRTCWFYVDKKTEEDDDRNEILGASSEPDSFVVDWKLNQDSERFKSF